MTLPSPYLADTSLRTFVVLVTGLAVLQLYLPVGGSQHITAWLMVAALYPSLSLLRSFPAKGAIRSLPFVGLVVLLASFVIAVAVSRDQVLGLKMIVWLCATIIAYLIGHRLGLSNGTERTLRCLLLWLMPFALMNVLFFVMPSLELAFLASPFARILLEPDTLTNLFDIRMGNNVLSPGKAGTLSVNANVASIIFGIGLCIAIFFSHQHRTPGNRFLVVVFLAAFLSTGSRAGIVAALLTATFTVLLLARRRHIRQLRRPIAFGFFVMTVFLLLPMGQAMVTRVSAVIQTVNPRLLLWYHAATLLAERPLAGVGFGGWNESWASFAAQYGLETMPPHNAYLMAWLWGGLLGAVGILAVVAGAWYTAVRLTRRPDLLSLGLLAQATTIWLAVQLFFTNFALIDARIGAIYFLSLGAIVATGHRPPSLDPPRQRTSVSLDPTPPGSSDFPKVKGATK